MIQNTLYFGADVAALLLFVLQLLMGPTAEEPGWRGYFFTEVSSERGILKGSVITGLVWGLWQKRQGRKVDLVFRHTRADDKIRIDPKMWIRSQNVDILLKVDYNIN